MTFVKQYPILPLLMSPLQKDFSLLVGLMHYTSTSPTADLDTTTTPPNLDLVIAALLGLYPVPPALLLHLPDLFLAFRLA